MLQTVESEREQHLIFSARRAHASCRFRLNLHARATSDLSLIPRRRRRGIQAEGGRARERERKKGEDARGERKKQIAQIAPMLLFVPPPLVQTPPSTPLTPMPHETDGGIQSLHSKGRRKNRNSPVLGLGLESLDKGAGGGVRAGASVAAPGGGDGRRLLQLLLGGG